MTKSATVLYSCALAMAIHSPQVQAQAMETPIDKNDPSKVLAYQGSAVLTQHEIDAAFSQIPEETRLLFIRDGAKVDQLVRSLLEIKMLKEDAMAKNLTDDALVSTAVQMAADERLAKLWIQKIPTLAPEADYETMAREDYLAHPENYDRNSSIDLTQILISTDDRSLEEAEKIALDLKAQLDLEPERFQNFVALHSDDESKATTFGQLKQVTKGKMVPEFEKAVFALKTVGEISAPISTQYGVHLVRLDALNSAGIPPFEAVREEAVEQQKSEHQRKYFQQYLGQLFSEPAVFPEGSVEIMAKRYFGENLELAPTFKEDTEE